MIKKVFCFELGIGAGWMIEDYEQTGIPFDRILIAQCKIERVPLVTRDPIFRDVLERRIAAGMVKYAQGTDVDEAIRALGLAGGNDIARAPDRTASVRQAGKL